MLNLPKRPIDTDTLDAWAKMLEDIAKAALLAGNIWSKSGLL
ncbi:hypothetical protein N8E87_08695 [Avibacterium paragallinarum]|nr:hypothetical protein [Avibacterium paragallinarum]UXN36255.1 hypothetical protein N8E87_08695 [Avibacterium paragallinarum]